MRLSTAAKKRRIAALLAHYTAQLGLADWRLETRFYRSREETDPNPEDRYAAGATVEPEYSQVRLGFVPSAMPDADLEHLVVHELGHAVVGELTVLVDFLIAREMDVAQRAVLKRLANDANERVATRLDRIFGRVLPPYQETLTRTIVGYDPAPQKAGRG